ncbi:MAG: CerR family C-terminal domain-containing protein, partial [Victivallaceae bacterium]
YFGDKENIYREAWRLSSELASGKYPLLDADLPPLSTIERLRNIIVAAICHALDDRCWDNGIMQQEIASKTNLLDDVHNKTVFHLRETLIPVVSELLAEANSEENVRQTTLSIVALCIVPVQKIQNIEQTNPYNYDIEQRIDHVVEFVIAGIEAIKKIYEKNHHSN